MMQDPSPFPTDGLLRSGEFHSLHCECVHLLQEIHNQQYMAPNRATGSVGFPQVKNLTTFQMTYMELRRWLTRIRGLYQAKFNSSLCRSESCLHQFHCLLSFKPFAIKQQYLRAFGSRETDMSRLQTLGEVLLRELSGADSLGLDVQSGAIAGINIADQLDEVNRLWQDTTAGLFASFGRDQVRCLRYIELDVQEIEAQLRSINRCTMKLKCQFPDLSSTDAFVGMSTLGTELKRIPAGDVALVFQVVLYNACFPLLQLQHASLKQALRVLSSADQLLNLLLSTAIDPVIRGLAATIHSSESSRPGGYLHDPLKVRNLSAKINDLVQAGYDIWLTQIELRERWKVRSSGRASTDMHNSMRPEHQTTSDSRELSVGDMNICPMTSGFPTAPLVNNWFSPSQRNNPRSELKIYPPLSPAPHRHGNKDASSFSEKIDQCSPDSWAFSPAYKESGFGSASDGTTPSMFSSHLSCSASDRSAYLVEPFVADDAFVSICATHPIKPRSLSLDCLRSACSVHLIGTQQTDDAMATLTSDDLQAAVTPEIDLADGAKFFNTERGQLISSLYIVRSKSLPAGIGVPRCPRTIPKSSYSPRRSVFTPLQSSPVLCASTPHARFSDSPATHAINMEELALDLSRHGLCVNPADLDDSTFSDLLPSTTEADSGSMNTPVSFSLFSPSVNKPAHMGEGDVCMDKSDRATRERITNDGRLTANNELEWDDSGDIREMTTRSVSSDSGFGLHSVPAINVEIPNHIIDGTPDTFSWNVYDTNPPSVSRHSQRRASFTFVGTHHVDLELNHCASWHSSLNCTENKVLQSSSQIKDETRTRDAYLRKDPSNAQIKHGLSSSRNDLADSVSPSEKPMLTGSSETLLSLFTGKSVFGPRNPDRILSPGPSTHNAFFPFDAVGLTNGNDSSYDHVLSTARSFIRVLSQATVMNGVVVHKTDHELRLWVNPSLHTTPRGVLPTSSTELVHLLESLRQDARPLIDLMCRLDQGLVPVHANAEKGRTVLKSAETVDLEQERMQLDIDRSFLKYYDRCLDRWTSISDDLCDKYGVSPSRPGFTPPSDNTHLSEKSNNLENLNKDAILVGVFADWLSGLKARHAALRHKLDSRALWLDHLAGLNHEVDQSLSVLADRVKNAVERACSMIQTLRGNCSDQTHTGDETRGMPADQQMRFGRTQVLQTLGELRELGDQVSTVELRVGASHLMEDSFDLGYPANHLRHSSGSNLSIDINSSGLNTSVDSPPNEGTVQLLFRQTAVLRQRLKLAIKRLERAAVLIKLDFPVEESHSITPTTSCSTVTQTAQYEEDAPDQQDSQMPTDDGHHLSIPLDNNHSSTSSIFCYLVPFLLVFLCVFLVLFGKSPVPPFSFSCYPRTDMSVVDFSPNWFVRHMFCVYFPTSDRHVW
ncbi:hypothetical protein T265_15309 [Opisthorchis viverrini]|uniref:Uncharacterized protein n=1 Tax=Opisthorchis viverrini TaxID=6198 RepID=A0A074ZZ56_OPIVI|nr:hypothetical protein T265_15309 [Opisthorchis viverrini]KER20469.1 hypothetical protein T265_15309 [Opisthorchis viverrini]